jgi:hypothetical protein
MVRIPSFALAIAAALFVPQTRAERPPQTAFAEPAIAPDGSEIAFVSGGDIWTVPAAGGEARLLVSNAANDTHPVYSPDRKQLAFVSTRTGGGDVYVLTFASGDVRRVTFDDGLDQLDGWSRDGKEKTIVVDQAWRLLRDNFFDPAFNGVDWTAARAQVEPFIAGSRTPDEMRRITSLMIGELNASHLGINAPAAAGGGGGG